MILLKFARWAHLPAAGLLLLLGSLKIGRAGPLAEEGAPTLLEATAPGAAAKAAEPAHILVRERGTASWYGHRWRGRRTASGKPFDDRAMTAAHLWLPFETRAHVTNLSNGRSVDVVVNDRGPYQQGRIIDLSARAAEALGIKECGIVEVIVSAQF